MKKLRLLAVRTDKEELLKELIRHGCVEFSELEGTIQGSEVESVLHRESTDVAALKSRHTTLTHAIELLDRYAPKKGKLLSAKPELEDRVLLDDTGMSGAVKIAEAIEGYDASKQFYTYGWDWYPDHLVWWLIHPETGEKVILWDYKGGKELFPGHPSKDGVPCLKTKYRLNFWHTNNWPVDTNSASIEKPLYPYELETDWMSYIPFN